MVSGWVTWTIVGLRLTAYGLRVGLSSGLKRICNETKALESYKDDRRPVFKSSPSQFMTIIYSVDYTVTGKDTGQVAGQDTSNSTSNSTSNNISEKMHRLVGVLKGEMSTQDMMEVMGMKSRPMFLNSYLNPALKAGLIGRTQPDSPKSPTQKYYLTEMGKALLNNK